MTGFYIKRNTGLKLVKLRWRAKTPTTKLYTHFSIEFIMKLKLPPLAAAALAQILKHDKTFVIRNFML